MNAEGVMTLVVVGSSVQNVVVVISEYSAQAEVVVVVVISGYEGTGVDSGNDVNAPAGVVCGGGNEGISVTVTTTVAGDSYWVTITVDTSVDNSVCVTGGRVFDSTTVVATAVLVEPPSTGTTEYVASLRANGRLLRGFGVKGRASARIVIARSARRLEDDESLMMRYKGDTQRLFIGLA
jgi:hypothetical protein